jgi:hypothetical protein
MKTRCEKTIIEDRGEMSAFRFSGIVTVILLIGKLLGLADIGWIWVFAPIWGLAALLVLLLILYVIVSLL